MQRNPARRGFAGRWGAYRPQVSLRITAFGARTARKMRAGAQTGRSKGTVRLRADDGPPAVRSGTAPACTVTPGGRFEGTVFCNGSPKNRMLCCACMCGPRGRPCMTGMWRVHRGRGGGANPQQLTHKYDFWRKTRPKDDAGTAGCATTPPKQPRTAPHPRMGRGRQRTAVPARIPGYARAFFAPEPRTAGQIIFTFGLK